PFRYGRGGAKLGADFGRKRDLRSLSGRGLLLDLGYRWLTGGADDASEDRRRRALVVATDARTDRRSRARRSARAPARALLRGRPRRGKSAGRRPRCPADA